MKKTNYGDGLTTTTMLTTSTTTITTKTMVTFVIEVTELITALCPLQESTASSSSGNTSGIGTESLLKLVITCLEEDGLFVTQEESESEDYLLSLEVRFFFSSIQYFLVNIQMSCCLVRNAVPT